MAAFDDYTRFDGIGLADLIARNEVSRREVLEAVIERIDTLNPALNAIVHRMDQAAMQTLERRLPPGPLSGVPFLLKDLGLFYAGEPLTNGSRFWADFVPDHDATLAERYRATGLVVLGKTNTPELGLSTETAPAALGPCHNPWALERSPGGSSGGAAAAVAARIVPLAHASDGGGSIRIPASACGLFGLKPTRARITAGPDVGEGWSGLSTAHCVSRSVRDSAALLDLTAGSVPGDPYQAPAIERPYLTEIERDPGRLRIGWITRPPGGPDADPDCVAAAAEAAQLCEDLGHEVDETALDYAHEAMVDAIITIIAGNVLNVLSLRADALGRAARPDDVEPVTWAFAERARQVSGADYPQAVMVIHSVGRALAAHFARFDVILSPTLAKPPLPLGSLAMNVEDLDDYNRRNLAASPFTALYNVAGCPAMSVPLAWNPEGLPIGVQFGAGFGGEGMLFRLAAQLEKARPWTDRQPTAVGSPPAG